MKVSNIQESGNNNLIKWALKHKANIFKDQQLQNLIQGDTYFHITYDDINFLDLFRLTQEYRNKLKILKSYDIITPSEDDLKKIFPGTIKDHNDVSIASLIHIGINQFINLSKQMGVDNDIISSSAQMLFIPMICRRYDVRIPMSFIDIVSFLTPEEQVEIFNENYPDTLEDIWKKDNIQKLCQMAFIQCTDMIHMNDRWKKYINTLYYNKLKGDKSDNLYKIAICGFYKYDNIERDEIRCTLCPMPDIDTYQSQLKKMEFVDTPLYVDFIIQLPLHYMQILENTFSAEELPIRFESDIIQILKDDIPFNNFITPIKDDEMSDEDFTFTMDKFNNEIESYKVRVAESNKTMLTAFPHIMDNMNNIGESNMYSLLPSIYNTKAIIAIDSSKEDFYKGRIMNSMLTSLFNDLFSYIKEIELEIKS